MINVVVFGKNYGGVFYHRLFTPHRKLAELCGEDYTIKFFDKFPSPKDYISFFRGVDIVVFNRLISSNMGVIRIIKFIGTKVVVDIDDYWRLDSSHLLYKQSLSEKWEEQVKNTISLADAVITTTDAFADEIRREGLNENVFVIPNSLDKSDGQFTPHPTESNKVRFGVLCGSSHLEDMRILNGLVERLPKDVLDECEFHLCGFDTESYQIIKKPNGKDVVIKDNPKDIIWTKYEKILTNDYRICSARYIKYLNKFTKEPCEFDTSEEKYFRKWSKKVDEYGCMYNDFDVLLVPLRDTKFNRMKSQLKTVEAGFMGKAIIASNVGPYTIDLVSIFDGHEKGNSILITDNGNIMEWVNAVSHFVKNKADISLSANNLKELVMEKYDLDVVTDIRDKLYKKLYEEANA